MNHIFVKQLEEDRRKAVLAGEMEDIKKKIKSGNIADVHPSRLLLVKPAQASEVMRLIVGEQLFRIFYSYAGGQNCLNIEITPLSMLVSYYYPKGKRMGSCAEVIKHNGEWLFTKYGQASESFALGLSDDQVKDFATELGFDVRHEERLEFKNSLVRDTVLGKALREWSCSHKILAGRLNKGDYTMGIMDCLS